MKQTEEKDGFKVLAVILAVLIVIAIAGSSVLIITSGSKEADSAQEKVKTVQLKAELPKENEKKLMNKVTVSAGGIMAKQNDDKKEKDDKKDKTSGDYVIADSSSKLLTNSDIAGMSAKELNYAKNEIYARHGRKFDSQELREYFSSKSWYEGKYAGKDFDANYSNSVLSDIEKKNAEFLKNAENKAQSGGYKLDQ